MDVLRISLVDPAPAGFTLHRTIPLRELRRGVFACMVPSAEEAERSLATVIGKIWGVLVTVGPGPGWEKRAPGLYHLRVPELALPNLEWVLSPVLDLVQQESMIHTEAITSRLDLDRLTEDMRRLSDQYADSNRLLSSELAEHRAAEKALEENRRWLRTLLDSMSDAVVVQEVAHGCVIEVNRRFCEMFGVSLEEASAFTLTNLGTGIAPYDEPHARALFDKAAAGAAQTFEWQVRHKAGHIISVEVGLKAAELAGRTYVLGDVRDISERKEAEAVRSRLEMKMQEAQKLESIGLLAGGIAHDFNNLLMVILGHADLLVDELPAGSRLRESVDQIIGASRRAGDLCSQMLAYAGKGRFVIRSINVNEVIVEMSHMLEVSVSKKVAVRYQLAPQIHTVQADLSQVQQVVMNLVINASEALDDTIGSIEISTGVRTCSEGDLRGCVIGAGRPEGDYVYIEVSDTGVGMQAETLGKIFDPFYSTKFAGRGLGLAAVQGIVNSHGGAISVASECGKGSRFRVYFPSASRAREVPAAVPPSRATATGAVMLVDDEQSVRQITSKMLEMLGYKVMAACDGQEALELLRADPASIRCIILDLNMPRMSGEDTYREIRKLDRSIPVLISSGYAEQDILERFSDKQNLGVIQKPYQMALLKSKIAAAFKQA